MKFDVIIGNPPYNAKDLYQYFELTQEEIDYIEETVK